MIKIRKAEIKDAENIVDINLKTWRTAYGDIFSERIFDNREKRRPSKIERIKELINASEVSYMIVCEVDGKVVGFASYGPCRDRVHSGELYAIYIYESYQKMGIGKRMVFEVSKHLQTLSYDNMIIWSLKDNDNIRFYLKLKGEPKLKKDLFLEGETYEEIGFVFQNLELIELLGGHDDQE